MTSPELAAESAPPSNAFATAGFVCSLLGLFLGGLLCPVGLVLAIVALSKPGGRGLAIAGIVLGAIGMVGWLLLFLLLGAVLLTAFGFAALTLAEPDTLELTADMVTIAVSAKAFENEHHALPGSLDDLELRTSAYSDPWGNAYDYFPISSPPGFDIVSAGRDGTRGTQDDVAFTRLGETWKAATRVDIDISSSDDEGRVQLRIGDRSLEVCGEEGSGRVNIDLGDRTLELEGDGGGGHLRIVPHHR